MDPISILIVDDHPIVRQGIRSLLNTYPDLQVIGEAGSSEDVITQISELSPDVILLDVYLKGINSIQLARQIHLTYPKCRIIILTAYEQDKYLFGALRAGVCAYLLKDLDLDELPSAIRSVNAGHRLISPALMTTVLSEYEKLAAESSIRHRNLNHTDTKLLGYMADGLTNEDIAGELGLTTASVKKKVRTILTKLGVANRTQAVALAIRQDLI